MRCHRLVPAVAAVALLLAACGTEGDPQAEPSADDPPVDDRDPAVPEDPDAPGGADEGLGDIEVPEVEDGVLRTQGVVLPIPEGWQVDEMALAQGLVGASPDEEQPAQLLLAGADIDTTPMFGVQDEDFDAAVETFRGLLPDGPDLDEEASVEGANRAHVLRFDDVAVQEQQPPTTELLLLAEDDEGHLALFNYAAASDAFDESIVDLLLSRAALDPDSEPQRPEPPPTEDGLEGDVPADDADAPGDDTTG